MNVVSPQQQKGQVAWNEADTCRTLITPKLQAAGWENEPHADPFDLLCLLAFHAPVLTRRQRADRVKRQQAAFFNYFKPEAQEILNELLEKYAADGELQFILPDVLKLPPISRHGTAIEIASTFGGPDELRSAVGQLQKLFYAE